MSEYQYYELAAIDRPLTREEMAQLRAVSKRAEITPTGFVSRYERGELNADPADWMRRWFDAYVYFANWCTCQLSLRVPRATFGDTALEPFAAEYGLRIEATAGGTMDLRLDAGRERKPRPLRHGRQQRLDAAPGASA